ncbi:hypothetical protein EBU91_05335 [bacterium]|nr:hypothetical protein [bacterium]
MVNIKRFIDKVGAIDSTSKRDFIMPVSEAKMLRDEIAKLLADKLERKTDTLEIIEVQVSGGKF